MADPIAAEIDGRLRDGSWSRVIGGLATHVTEPIESVVFVLVTPATAQRAFGQPAAVAQRRHAVALVVPLERARAVFLSLRLLRIVATLARRRGEGEFVVAAECSDGWRLVGGPSAVLPRCAAVAHAATIALLGADGRCAADECNSAHGGSA